MSGLATAAVFNSLESHVLATGLFRQVNTHEPKKAPPDAGLTAAVWMDRVAPHPAASGLQITTAVTVYMIRIYTNMLAEPQDAIDPAVLAATDTLFTSLHGDFELGGNARNIDLLGETGNQLSAQAGYVDIDGVLYRVMDITVPVIVNDVWTQTA
jgi:hypothetical protein